MTENIEEKKMFMCGECEQKFNVVNDLKHHMVCHLFQCPYCKKIFTSKDILLKYNDFKHKEYAYYCDLCYHKTATKYGANSHKQAVHEGILLNCNDCSYRAKYAGGLSLHRQKVHNGERRFNCKKCYYKAYSQSLLKKHDTETHERKYRGVFQCDLCDLKASTKPSLRRHKATIHEGVKYKCDLCAYQSNQSKDELKLHKLSVHDGLRYDCDMCDYRAVHNKNFSPYAEKKTTQKA